MKKTMKAMVIRAPMQFDVEDVPVPECPEAGFLLKVIACGLCGSDLRTLRGGAQKCNHALDPRSRDLWGCRQGRQQISGTMGSGREAGSGP